MPGDPATPEAHVGEGAAVAAPAILTLVPKGSGTGPLSFWGPNTGLPPLPLLGDPGAEPSAVPPLPHPAGWACEVSP